MDFGTGGNVTSFNHGFFAQDAWTIGRGLTINAGVASTRNTCRPVREAGLNVQSHQLRMG